jgi:uncharacterized protein Yka (UPF0111/DUF47 family)
MLFAKDKKPVDLISDHIDTVVGCIRTSGRAVESYIEGYFSIATELALQADALELDANHKLDEITSRLYQWGGLAPIRSNLYQLASSLSRAAEDAAVCSLFFLDRRPEIPQSFRLIFKKLAATAFKGYPEIKNEALNCLKGSWHRGEGCGSARKFGNIQEELKNICRDLYRRISEIEDAPWQQMTLDTCMTQITGVYDIMAMTADTITRINLRLGN